MNAVAKLVAAWPGPEAPLRVLGASGQLGLGIPEESFRRGIEAAPHVIAADMGSIDPGPTYLGSGKMAAPEGLARRDLKLVLTAARSLDVPLLIGSAGTAGAGPHLDRTLELVREVARDAGLSFRLGIIRSDIDAETVINGLSQGRLHAIGELPIDGTKIAATPHIVGQAGVAEFLRLLEFGPDVIVAGRACDTAPFAAIPAMLGYPLGPAMHMAKILECSSICCEPGGRDAILGTLQNDVFTLESMALHRRATPRSVAAHALYEQADPYEIREPGGRVRLDNAQYEALDARRVLVRGAVWEDAPRPTVKVEGARSLGARVVGMYGAADPAFIRQSGEILSDVEHAVRDIVPGEWAIHARRYGIDGVSDQPGKDTPSEICLLLECVAPDAETARTALTAFRQQLLHWGFPGRCATGGNLAIPFTPAEVDAGEAWEYCIYHILELETWEALEALFPLSLEVIGETS